MIKGGTIYKITGPSGKIYIGQTRNLNNRIKDHFKRTHSECTKLHKAISKYGKENFTIDIVIEKDEITDEDLNILERFWITNYNSCKNGYNIREGGNVSSGWKHSEATKNKISNSKKGQGIGKKLPQNSINFSGGLNPRAKRVRCIDNNREFSCAKDAAVWCNGDNSTIIKCCKNKLNTHKNLRWEYIK